MPSLGARELTQIFKQSEKPPSAWRVGLEVEKFGFGFDNRPLQYDGPGSVNALLRWLERERGWRTYAETDGGPIVALERDRSAVTLEPGGQVELSGAPHGDLHALATEYDAHLTELRAAAADVPCWFAHVGFHPSATHEQLSWVPKRRYPIMRRFLPTRGARGVDMMLRTSTVQVNLDYSDEQDALLKLLTLLKLTPLIQAMTVNAPFIEGQRSPLLSERLDTWLHMDPSRSGLIAALWNKPNAGYEDYIQWGLDAGMFLFLRDGELFENTGQTFRDFNQQGFRGQQATEADWRLHLGTLFPEVRLKSTLEVRCCDSLPPPLTYSLPALLVGLVYDDESLQGAAALADRFDHESAVALQRRVAREGLAAVHDGEPVLPMCTRLLDLAESGLRRRARQGAGGKDEAIYLAPLQELVRAGLTPADLVLKGYRDNAGDLLGYLRKVWDAPLADQ
jgi:glutamate--cysteine ligase